MKDYTKYTKLGRVKLNKSSLEKLVTLITESFPLKNDKEYSIWTNVGDASISENN